MMSMSSPSDPPQSPQHLWGALFAAVQQAGLFPDGKAFADAVPRGAEPAEIRLAFEQQGAQPGFDLGRFVQQYFDVPHVVDEDTSTSTRIGIEQHIRELWPRLLRSTAAADAEQGSLLALPRPYIVPGGRFREVYYWDSAFTMQALLLHDLRPVAQDMLDNFVALVRRVGHVPNGNRSYMLSRSQPPLLYRMVEMLSADEPARYLDVLQAEHRFWMAGETGLAPGQCERRVVRLADGALLNRYWDDECTPRDESWREDVETAAEAAPHRPAAEVWRDLRAGAESGWDFSSRWCADPSRLSTIETTALLPVDLNALLWGLEQAIVRGARAIGDVLLMDEFDARASSRADAVRRHLWSAGERCFVDADWRSGVQRELTAATVVPLYTGLASAAEAAAVAELVQAQLLGANGLRTSLRQSGQQWDRPNGWAPLQVMAVEGLLRYGHKALALDLAQRWISCLERVFDAGGKLVEKYDTELDRIGGGGEYPTQDGFGWTNASYVIFKRLVEANR